MKIAIEARALAARGGVSRYVANVTTALKRIAGSHDITILEDGPRHELLLPWWLHYQVPARLAELSPDVVHFTKADIPRRRVAPTVVTIYDVIPLLLPQSQKWLQRWYWPRALQRAAQGSDHILTISEASKRDIVRLCGVAADKITVTPLAIDSTTFRPAATDHVQSVRRRLGLIKPYILFVGTIEPRKNIPALIEAFSRVADDIPHDLVLAGRVYKGRDEVERARAARHVRERIRLLDFVEQADLPALYTGADLFVWPSIYEGWGFPPHEAMACGTPVIVSDGGSLPEVVGQAAEIVSFSESDVQSRLSDTVFVRRLADAIGAVLTHERRREELAAAGQRQARQTTWDTVARRTLAVYERLGHR